MIWLDALTVGPVAFATVMTAYNMVRWPDDAATSASIGRVSVLVPARNEETNIAACVASLIALTPPVHEIIVCDDDSTDSTPAILAALSATESRLRVIGGESLPAGWVGKPYACHRLGAAATGDLLVFIDADVRMKPDGIARIEALRSRWDADVVTLFPEQVMHSLGERVVLPLLALTFAAWFPLDWVPRHPDRRALAVSGQLLAFTRAAYHEIGGYEAVYNEVVDDVAICTRAKELGQTVVFATGRTSASCRMYDGFGEVWRGFSKNFYEGLNENPITLIGVVATYFAAFVLPYVRLSMEFALGTASVAALVGVALNLALRIALAYRLKHGLVSILLHPIGALATIGIAINSALWSRRGQVAWRGRAYASRGERA